MNLGMTLTLPPQFAYCYPYTYSQLQLFLETLDQRKLDYYKRELLGHSVVSYSWFYGPRSYIYTLSMRGNDVTFCLSLFSNRGGWTFSLLLLLTYSPPPPPPHPLLAGWCSSLAGSTLERPLPPSCVRVCNNSYPAQTCILITALFPSGLVEYLVSDDPGAKVLRDNVVFKIGRND